MCRAGLMRCSEHRNVSLKRAPGTLPKGVHYFEPVSRLDILRSEIFVFTTEYGPIAFFPMRSGMWRNVALQGVVAPWRLRPAHSTILCIEFLSQSVYHPNMPESVAAIPIEE